MIPHPLQLFSPVWYEPVNTSTQVDRMPGVDAPCLCGRERCGWPFCTPEVQSEGWPFYEPDPRPEGTTP